MPRFRDEWVIDRVMFDYVSGGSCACCGFQHLFLPNGVSDLVDAVSDLDTDQADREKAALLDHPWPSDLREQVWVDRVRLRQGLKRDRDRFDGFWASHSDGFVSWLHTPGTIERLRRWLQVPRTEVMEVIQQKYSIHSAFAVVLCAVVEQVAGFKLTEYPPDGRGDVERDFETKLLSYDRRGGFVLPLVSEDGVLRDDMVDVWLRRLSTLGGPVLLERGASSSSSSNPSKMIASKGAANHEGNDEGDDDDDDDDVDGMAMTKGATPSFASDRRIIRLVIARIFADTLQEKYLETTTTTSTTI